MITPCRLDAAVETVTKERLPPHVKSIELHLGCVDESQTVDGEPVDVEVPPVKYNYCNKLVTVSWIEYAAFQSERTLTERQRVHYMLSLKA